MSPGRESVADRTYVETTRSLRVGLPTGRPWRSVVTMLRTVERAASCADVAELATVALFVKTSEAPRIASSTTIASVIVTISSTSVKPPSSPSARSRALMSRPGG